MDEARDDLFHFGAATTNVIGTVVDDATEVPLGGSLVRWMGPADKEGLAEIGRATTADDGSFVVMPADDPASAQALCRLDHTSGSKGVLLVGEDADPGPKTGTEVPTGPAELLIRFKDAGDPPDIRMWQAVSAYLMSNRMLRASDLARELAGPSSDGPARAWPVTTRAAGLRSIAEPLGVTHNGGLLDQQHFLNLPALAEGDLRKALTTFQPGSGTMVGPAADGHLGGILGLPPDLLLYRDYLRSVWVTAARQMYATSPLSVTRRRTCSNDNSIRASIRISARPA